MEEVLHGICPKVSQASFSASDACIVCLTYARAALSTPRLRFSSQWRLPTLPQPRHGVDHFGHRGADDALACLAAHLDLQRVYHEKRSGAKGSKLCALTQRGPELVSIKNSPGSSDGSAGFRSPLAGICQSGNNPLSDHRSFELRHRPMIVNIALPIVLLVMVEQRTYIDARSTLSCSRQSELDHLSTFRPVPMETNFGEPSFCFWNRMEQS